MSGNNTIEIKTLNNCNMCWYCSKKLPAIGNQRKNGKTFQSYKNGSNDWKTRKYHKKCYKSICEMKTNCYMTYGMTGDEEIEYIKTNLKHHNSFLDHKRNELQDKLNKINERERAKLEKKNKSK